MKTYSFSNLVVRGYPTAGELANPYIYGGVRVLVNVSEHPYDAKLSEMISDMGIETHHFPLSETAHDMGFENLLAAVKVLKGADSKGEKTIVHCMCGNNRSRTVAEAFHYLKEGRHYEDEYKGQFNHLFYNSRIGLLPDIATIEDSLSKLI